MPFSDSYANDILNYLFSKTTELTAPKQVYIGLCSNDPEADNGTFVELSGNGYSRVLISIKGNEYPTKIANAASRAIQNIEQINWTKATGDWIPAKGFGLFSAPTGGSPFFYGRLEKPITCEAGAVALFDPKSLKVSFPKTNDPGVLFASQNLGIFAQNTDYNTCMVAVEPAPFPVTVGTTYRVVWDGAEFKVTAQDGSDVMEGAILLGNGSAWGLAAGEDPEPFAIVYTAGGTAFCAVDSTEETHSVSVFKDNT